MRSDRVPSALVGLEEQRDIVESFTLIPQICCSLLLFFSGTLFQNTLTPS